MDKKKKIFQNLEYPFSLLLSLIVEYSFINLPMKVSFG